MESNNLIDPALQKATQLREILTPHGIDIAEIKGIKYYPSTEETKLRRPNASFFVELNVLLYFPVEKLPAS